MRTKYKKKRFNAYVIRKSDIKAITLLIILGILVVAAIFNIKIYNTFLCKLLNEQIPIINNLNNEDEISFHSNFNILAVRSVLAETIPVIQTAKEKLNDKK